MRASVCLTGRTSQQKLDGSALPCSVDCFTISKLSKIPFHRSGRCRVHSRGSSSIRSRTVRHMSDELVVQARSVPSSMDDSPLRHGGNQPPCTFRPCRSSRLRRFTPRHPLQVCCTLQPVIGFAVFRVTRHRHPATASEDAMLVIEHRGTFPSGAIPFEAFPSFKAFNA
jgi:hypothetical protein